MIKKYNFAKTSKIHQLEIQLEIYSNLFNKNKLQPQVKENLLRKSTLKSALYSAKIEGNTLEFGNIEYANTKREEKKEVFQIYEAIKIAQKFSNQADSKFICELHSIVMDGLTNDLGRWRSEPSAIFNSAGVAIYITPPAQNVKDLIEELAEFINVNEFDITRAAYAHFIFEKIHPFLDGNGRVGRILLKWQIAKMYDFIWYCPFEEYIEANREIYYSSLAAKENNIAEFIEFILEAIVQSSEKLILDYTSLNEDKPEDFLLPRRSEILLLIREHQMISFDEIKRRFLAVNSRTLHFDLQDLLKKGLIKKLGETKGVVYTPK